jgi:hypothetical protein
MRPAALAQRSGQAATLSNYPPLRSPRLSISRDLLIRSLSTFKRSKHRVSAPSLQQMKIATLPPEPDGAGGAAGVRRMGAFMPHHLLMTRAGRANERRTLKQMMLPIAAEKVGRETHTPRTGRFAGAWLIASGLSSHAGDPLIDLGHPGRRSDQQAAHTPMRDAYIRCVRKPCCSPSTP